MLSAGVKEEKPIAAVLVATEQIAPWESRCYPM